MKTRVLVIICLICCFALSAVLGRIVDSSAMSKSAIDGLGSTEASRRRDAIATLIHDGPMRLEEIERAERSLREILDMRERLVTTRRDWRVGHTRPPEETQEAIDFFLKHDGVAWLAECLSTDDWSTRAVIVGALIDLDPQQKRVNAELLVSSAVRLLKDTRGTFTGDATGEITVRANLARLTAELIGTQTEHLSNPESVLDRSALDAEEARIAEAGDRWLAQATKKREN